MSIYTIPSEDQLQLLIHDLLPVLKAPVAVALHGDLGAGKTSLSRQIIRTLSGDSLMEVPSPTFTLVQQYEAPASTIYHYDLYRMKDPEELHELGWHDALSDGIVLIEWPERAGRHLPAGRHDLFIRFGEDENERRIEWIRNGRAHD